MFTLPRLHNLPIMKKYGFLFFLLLTSISLFAQANVRRTKTKGLIYTQEKTVNLSFNTSGFSFGYAKGKLKNYKVTPFWQFEFGRLKHPKSYKQVADITGNRNSKPYTYGKKNVFMTLRAMRGHKHYFSEKAKTKGVAVGMQYMAGLSLGLVKPYYLNIQRGVNPVDPTVGADVTDARRLRANCCLNTFAVALRAQPSVPEAPGPRASDSVSVGEN